MPFVAVGDFVLLSNTAAQYLHVEGPTCILSLPTATEQAAVIAGMLLQAFNLGLGPSHGRPFAPLSWASDSHELAETVSARMAEVGVRRELRTIGSVIAQDLLYGGGLVTAQDITFAEFAWVKFVLVFLGGHNRVFREFDARR